MTGPVPLWVRELLGPKCLTCDRPIVLVKDNIRQTQYWDHAEPSIQDHAAQRHKGE